MDTTLLKSRITQLKSGQNIGNCVVYVMSRDQRVQDNHALLAAQQHALAKDLPLAVVFCLYEKAGYRRREHFAFMIDGLREVEQSLAKYDVPFMMLFGNAVEKVSALASHVQPDAIYFDMNPLRGPRKVQQAIADAVDCSVFVVDTHNVVPMLVASDKLEFGAYTIRPKIHKQLAIYLVEPEQLQKHPYVWPGVVKSLAQLEGYITSTLDRLPTNGSTIDFDSGEKAASDHLKDFIATKLERYAVYRNDPSSGSQSDLSPYLHFGQISALRVALELQKLSNINDTDLHLLQSPKLNKPEDAETTLQHGIDSLAEELICRKELADNNCYFNENYDNVDAAHSWAKKTIAEHDNDDREHLYTYEQLEKAQTHDPAWNAAQTQLTKSGKMHGYMRMYWAKKIKEWTQNASTAIEWSIRLNDTYSIDGGDPNGYAGITWSIIGVHDRAWTEREVFGKIRYMNYGGLKRKFDIEAYIEKWAGNETLL